MLLTIHDSNLRKVAFIDNDKQDTLNYSNDTWTRYLETGSSTFDFTVFKKAIISDVGKKRAYNSLNEKAFVSFRYKGRTYLHTIRKIEENEKVIKCYSINLNLELINEYSIPYKSPKAMSFKEFCEEMDLLNYTFLKIGINEVANKKISAEWEGTDTKLNRLLSLAKKFGAEIEFDTRLNADSSIKSFTVNVYHEHDDSHQGVGQISPTILKYGKNLKTITRTIDKTGIYNSVKPTGKDEHGNVIDISGLGAWSVNNAKGEREFYQIGAYLVAPISMQMYPSTFTHSTGTLDQYIRKDMTVESSNPEVIRSMAYRELKKNCYPAVTYEAEGFADLEIGDTVKVYDDGFSPTLLLEMRVSEQVISFTNPRNNKTTFSNAKALENRLSQGIQQQLDRMIENAKPCTIKLATDNGIAFKNGQGQTIVTPTLMRGNKVINSGWRWVVDGVIKSTSPSYIVRASDINQKMVLTVSAWIDNKEVASEQLTLINTSDGTAGKTQYLHRAWANSEDGRDGFSTSSSANKRYFGTYTDFTEADSQDPTSYNWTALFDNVRVGARNFALGTARATIGNQGKTYTLAQSAQNWPTVQPLYLTFDYVASETIKGFRLNRVIKYSNSSPDQWDFTTNDKVLGRQYIDTTSVKSGTYSQAWLWKPYSNGRTSDLIKEIALYLNFEDGSDGTVIISNLRVNTGTVSIDWIPAPEDIEDSLNSKADQGLTQEQINALSEKTQIHEAELKAKASMKALGELEKAYNAFVKSNTENQKKSEADLVEAGRRLELLTTEFGGMKELKKFIDTYMSSSNEGLIIGKNDASSTIKVTHDRISMFSAGKEVMYISQGVINIDNGIFTASVQIGRFRTEEYYLNQDVNVIRYVGG